MGTKFRDLVRKVEDEARKEGPRAIGELEAFRTHFRLARQLAELRRARRLSQQRLALLSGIAQADISRIERGHANPTVQTLAALAKPLKAELSYVPEDKLPLLGAGGERHPSRGGR